MTASILPAAEATFISTLPARIQADVQARYAVQRGEMFDVLAVCTLLKITPNALWKRIRKGSFPRPDVVINRNLQLWRRASLSPWIRWFDTEQEAVQATAPAQSAAIYWAAEGDWQADPVRSATQAAKPAPTLWMRFLRKLNIIINRE